MDVNAKFIHIFMRVWATLILIHPADVRCQEVALIFSGTIANITSYPYHVVIYEQISNSEACKQICGGTLISTKFVVSAAHCFWDEEHNKKKSSDLYKIRAGNVHKSWSQQANGSLVQERQISNISLPKRFLGRVLSYENDIAVATLDEEVLLTESVGVADVDWQDTWTADQLVSSSQGVVAGWGMANSGKESDALRVVSLPYVDPDTCFDSLEFYLKQFLTHDKFCAGFENTTVSMCHGDSGAGLVFHHREANKYHLRGVVSVAFKPAGTKDACFAQQYTTFTMVKPRVLCGLISNTMQEQGVKDFMCGSAEGMVLPNRRAVS